MTTPTPHAPIAVGERVEWTTLRGNEPRTGTVEFSRASSRFAYVKSDNGYRQWMHKNRLTRIEQETA